MVEDNIGDESESERALKERNSGNWKQHEEIEALKLEFRD